MNYQNIGELGNSSCNSEEDKAITKETKERTKEKESPRREVVGGNARKQTHALPNIIGHSQNSNLLLVERQNRFERRRIEREVEGISNCYLNPNCSSKTHPGRSASSFQNQLRHFWI